VELEFHHLQYIIPGNPYISYWHTALKQLLPDYQIDTPKRISGFLAQCMHESGKFLYTKENLNYRWQSLRKVFPKYFPTDDLAKQYEKQPEKIANRVYANRMGNGPEESGDGWKYCGRGLIQLTGLENYSWFAASISTPVDEVIEYTETFEGAAQSACWFWESNGLNIFADAGDVVSTTRRVNPGLLGLEERTKYYNYILQVLNM